MFYTQDNYTCILIHKTSPIFAKQGTVYSLFRDDGATEMDLVNITKNGSDADVFYAFFYLGLFCESRGETSKAEYYMKSAAMSLYAQSRGRADYMTSVAKVHCKERHWSLN